MVAFVSGLLLAGIVAAVAARPERWWSPGEGRVFPATLDYDVVIPNLPWRTSKPSGAAVRGTVGSSLFPSECRASLRVRHTSSRLNASRQSTRARQLAADPMRSEGRTGPPANGRQALPAPQARLHFGDRGDERPSAIWFTGISGARSRMLSTSPSRHRRIASASSITFFIHYPAKGESIHRPLA